MSRKNDSQIKNSFKRLFQKDRLAWLRWGFVVAAACTPIYLFRDVKLFSNVRGFSIETFVSGAVIPVLISFILFLGALGAFELLPDKLFPAKIPGGGAFQFFLGAVSWVVFFIVSMMAYLFIIALAGPVLFDWING